VYMERIEVPTEIVERRQPRIPNRPLLSLTVGLVVICISIVVMLPYWAAFAIYACAAFLKQVISRASVAAYQSVMYAGEVALGK
jgi:hypothetical protein